MSQETELDDLDLDKLLDDEDFLEDFDFDDPVAESDLQAGGAMFAEDEPSGTAVSAAVASIAVPDDSAAADAKDSQFFLKKIVFPLSIVLAVLLLLLQVYTARKLFSPKHHIYSATKKVAIAEVVTHDLAEKAEKAEKAPEEKAPEEKALPADVVTFKFYYPLYSLAGLKILGVDVQLVFPPRNPSPLTAEQIELLKKSMRDSLDQVIAGRMLEELGQDNDFFVEPLRTSLTLTLKQWRLPLSAIRLEGLVVH